LNAFPRILSMAADERPLRARKHLFFPSTAELISGGDFREAFGGLGDLQEPTDCFVWVAAPISWEICRPSGYTVGNFVEGGLPPDRLPMPEAFPRRCGCCAPMFSNGLGRFNAGCFESVPANFLVICGWTFSASLRTSSAYDRKPEAMFPGAPPFDGGVQTLAGLVCFGEVIMTSMICRCVVPFGAMAREWLMISAGKTEIARVCGAVQAIVVFSMV